MNPWAASVITFLLLGLLLWWNRRERLAGPTRRLRIVESLTAGPGRSLAVVRAGGRCLLVGSSKEGWTLLAELPAQDWRDEPAPKARAAVSSEG